MTCQTLKEIAGGLPGSRGISSTECRNKTGYVTRPTHWPELGSHCPVYRYLSNELRLNPDLSPHEVAILRAK